MSAGLLTRMCVGGIGRCACRGGELSVTVTVLISTIAN